MEIQNRKIPEGEFMAMRQEVLQQWPTGRDVDLTEAAVYQKQQKPSRNFSARLIEAKKEHKTLIQPRAGVPVLEEHIKLLQYLEKEGEADLLPTTIDSYTRQNRYTEAEEGIKASQEEGRAMLNGFPAVNHGVYGCRRVVESVNVPVQVRHGTPDARLLTEIAYAGGFTSYEGGGISYNLPYCKNVPMETTIANWQYVDRLTGLYEDMAPGYPAEAGYQLSGNLIQDVAAVRTLEELTEEYLAKYGYHDVFVTTVLHQWMGGFPADEAKAFGVISTGALIAALSKATKVIVKSPHEAIGIPTMEANAQGLRCTRQVVSMMSEQTFANTHLDEEMEIIRQETRCIVDKCFELGRGDIALGVCRGVKAGVLDVPFAPCRYNAGQMLPCRDNDGAVRIMNMGNLPFTKELRDYHMGKIAERAAFEHRKATFQMVTDDVYAISKGRLVGRPR